MSRINTSFFAFAMVAAVDHIVWLSTDKMGDSPWIFHLDKKKKQIISSDFSNDKKLAARFSFGNGALKKCG